MKKFAIEIKWGIRYIFACLAWAILEKSTGTYSDSIANYPMFSFLFYLFGFMIYIMALQDKKKNFLNGKMDWKQGCVSGIFMTIAVAILMPFCQIIIHKAIAPEFFPNMIRYALARNYMKAGAANSYYNLTAYISQSVFFALSVGVVFSALAAQFTKTKNTVTS